MCQCKTANRSFSVITYQHSEHSLLSRFTKLARQAQPMYMRQPCYVHVSLDVPSLPQNNVMNGVCTSETEMKQNAQFRREPLLSITFIIAKSKSTQAESQACQSWRHDCDSRLMKLTDLASSDIRLSITQSQKWLQSTSLSVKALKIDLNSTPHI
jgi:hypothetical protein